MYSDLDTEILCRLLMEIVLNDDPVPVDFEAELDERGITLDDEYVSDLSGGTVDRWTTISVYQGSVTVH